MTRAALASFTLLFAVPRITVATPAVGDCAALATLAARNTTVTLAQGYAAGTLFPNAPAVCRFKATVAPAVTVEIWLPESSAWNGKFQGVGNGGLAGTISTSALRAGVLRGYATASTDTGHVVTSPDGLWALDRPELIHDFGYRATHEMTVLGKRVTAAYYGLAPQRSYFVGCSKGGQQALQEAQRFPEDYDGIVAGDPAAYWTWHYLGGHLWPELGMMKDTTGESYISPAKLPAIERAVNAQCDGLDGVVDGILTDPRRCSFDPSVLLCPGAETNDCLTAKQLAALQGIYAGPPAAPSYVRSPFPGNQVYPGIQWGAETGWQSWITGNVTFPGPTGTLPTHLTLGIPFFKYFVFDDPTWDWHFLPLTTDVWTTNFKPVCAYGGCPPMKWVTNADDPDLSRFKALGNKLIQYHGFSDPDIPGITSINYYESVLARSLGYEPGERDWNEGRERARNNRSALERQQAFYRLFMVPGMWHCSGGPGPTTFDALGALEQWVERGIAPDSIPAAHVVGSTVTMTRPLCPYPQEAIYKGSGDTNSAARFACGVRP